MQNIKGILASCCTALYLIVTVFYRQDCYFIAYTVWIMHFNIHFVKVAWPLQFFRQSKSYWKLYFEEPTHFFSSGSFCLSWQYSNLCSWHYIRIWPSFVMHCDYSWWISFLYFCIEHFGPTVCTLLLICMCYNSEVPKHEISL